MKKLLLLLFIATASIPAEAQFFQFGIRGGVSSFNVNYQGFPTLTNEKFESISDLGIHLGFYSRIQLLGFYVQPELLYLRTGSQIISTQPGGNNVTIDLRFQRLDMPILVGKRFLGVFRANAGPVFSSLIRADLTADNIKGKITDGYRNNTVGFQIGVGIDIWKLVLDLKYEGSLSKIGTNLSAGGQTFLTDARPSQWLLSVGYRVF